MPLREDAEMPGTESSLPVRELSSLLRNRYADDMTIESVDWKNLTDPGENYGSLIIALNAKVRLASRVEVLNLVVKLPPPSRWLQELFNTPFTFLKELQFYRDLTPAFLALQRENGIAEPEKTWLGADYYGGRMGLGGNETFDDQAAIVLQNLNYDGYKMLDRLVGLRASEAELGVRKLAKLHAIAIAMRVKKPRVFESLIMPCMGQPANETAKSCLMDMIEKAIDDLNDIPQCAPHVTSVRKTIEHSLSVDHSGASVPKDKWATLVHNDFWLNNMMFRYDEAGEPLDMKIVDFQLYVYDYGFKDLVFFLISSLATRVIEKDFDRLVDLYYESFVEILDSLSVNVADFPKEEFHERLEECATLKLQQCLMMNQVIKSKSDKVPKMEEIDSKESFLQIGGGEIYRQKMLHTVEFFYKRGWLKK